MPKYVYRSVIQNVLNKSSLIHYSCRRFKYLLIIIAQYLISVLGFMPYFEKKWKER